MAWQLVKHSDKFTLPLYLPLVTLGQRWNRNIKLSFYWTWLRSKYISSLYQ